MRLTLRTLLAYVDDILEPEDAQAISKKIEESEFATSLLHRTRDVMRRLRLGAPDVADRAVGLDPNTVGEYLDNTLPDDQVLDFEKVCLESDIHLAEVAACHQILALVLGEPAEVDPESRQRMYQLLERAGEVSESTGVAPSAPAAAGPAGKPRAEASPRGSTAAATPAKAPVPEWLREETRGRRRWWRMIAGAGVIAACGIAVLALTGQLPLDLFVGSGQPAPSLTQGPGPGEADPQRAGEAPAEPALEQPSEEPPSAFPPDTGQGPEAAAPGEAQATDAPAASEPVAEPSPEPGPPLRQPTAAAEPDRPGMARPVPAEPAPGVAAEGAAGPAAQPAVTDVAVTAPDAARLPVEERAMPGGAAPEARPDAAAAPVPREPVGQLDSPMQIVLRFDPEKNAWHRLPEGSPLLPQTKYLSLPTYRPVLRLLNGVRVRLIGAVEIELMPGDANGVPGVAFDYGRVVVEASEEAPSRLQLAIADQLGTITFEDGESRLAVELSRSRASNSDPETQPATMVINLYAASGQFVWQGHEDDRPTVVAAPLRFALHAQPPGTLPIEAFPTWIAADTMSLLDQRASDTVQRELAVTRSAELGLRELADHRRREVRWLALRCLDALGSFELMVTALDNPERSSVWPEYVEQLRAAVMRTPETAAQVRTAMEKLHGIEGARLYEMLWRYNHDLLDSQEAADLVDDLEHDTLAFRVVAFHTLRRITKLSINYRPEDTAPKRQPWVEKWRERLLSSARPRPEGTGDSEESPEGPSPSAGEDFPL